MLQDKLIVSQTQSNQIIEENTNQIYLKEINMSFILKTKVTSVLD